MQSQRLISCAKIVGILYALSALILGITSAFVEMPLVDELVFRSPIFHVVVFAAFWVIAWFATRRGPIE